MNKKRIAFVVVGIIAMLLIASAIATQQHSLLLPTANYNGRPAQSEMQFGIGGGGAPVEMPFSAPMPDLAMPTAAIYDQTASNVSAASAERVVIQNADLAIVVSDVGKRMKEIEDLANKMGGHLVSSNLYQSYTNNGVEVPEATIVIRVPSAKLNEALATIKEGAVEILSENRSGTDVTEQYVDLQSRLKAKKAAEAKLLEIMESAQTTEDVLAVYQQLQSIQTEIESLTGQINYIEQSAALSAVSVRLVAEETIQPVKVGPWEPKGVALEAVQDLINFSKGFVEFLIRFVIFTLPSWIMVGVPLYLLFLGGRAIYRRIRKNQPKKESAPSTEEK